MSSSPSESPSRQWRFTWETLAHIPTLRLYLFHPEINPSSRFRNLNASLRLSESLLLVTWLDEEGAGDVTLSVPVPRILIDPSLPVGCAAREDHIEVKLALVLPVDHPMVKELGGVFGEEDGVLDRLLPLSMESDLQNLSCGGVHFFCKTCSTRLTAQPVSNIVEVPSSNWREAADNWFGACCCSFGGISEKLVSQYIRTYECAAGTCLLDDASVIVCMDDLEGYTFQQCVDRYSKSNNKSDVVTGDSLAACMKESCNNAIEHIPDSCNTSTCASHKVGQMISDLEIQSSEWKSNTNPLTCPLLSPADFAGNVTQGTDQAQCCSSGTQIAAYVDFSESKLDHCSGCIGKPVSESADEFSSTDQPYCCANEAKYVTDSVHGRSIHDASVSEQSSKSYGPCRNQRWLHDCSFGGGFATRTSNLANDVEWVEFLCRQCSSNLGSYPSLRNANVPVDGGIRLFKCYISTSVHVGGPNDIFRKHTLQKVFMSLLLEGAKDELSYRTVIKDFGRKFSRLQLVLLNSKAWNSTGFCFENAAMKPHPETYLQPVAKVLFSDCTNTSEACLRTLGDWSTKTHAEEVHMMTHEIEDLTKNLKSAANRLPLSCSSLQGRFVSYMDR